MHSIFVCLCECRVSTFISRIFVVFYFLYHACSSFSFIVGDSEVDFKGMERYPYRKGHTTPSLKTNNIPAGKQPLRRTKTGIISSLSFV